MAFNPDDYEPVLDSVQRIPADFRISGNEVIHFNNIQNAFSIHVTQYILLNTYNLFIQTVQCLYINIHPPLQDRHTSDTV